MLLSSVCRRTLAMVAAMTLVATASMLIASAQTRTLRFVSPARPPFTESPGKPRFALDLVEEALKRINVTATTTIVPPGEYGQLLLTGPYDGTALGWRDSARDQAFLLSDPYLENRLVLIGRRGSDVSATTLGALKGKRIAIINGYAYGDNFETSGPTFVRSNAEQDSLRLLLDSKVEYVLMDELVVQYMIDAYPEETRTRLQIGMVPLVSRPVHMMIRKTVADAATIIAGFNKQLRAMITDRTYHKLLHVNWILADIDGDGKPEYVAAADQAGKTQPSRAYNLFTQEKLDAAVQKDQERYFFGGAVYNGWSSVPDKYKTDYLDRTDAQHPTARIFTFSWK